LLAVAFAVVHVAYGAGMLRGLWRFRRRFVGPDRQAPERTCLAPVGGSVTTLNGTRPTAARETARAGGR
jgi:hypothetical protein